MFQPIDPIESRKQALIAHLVGRAGMAGGGRPVGTNQGRGFGSFVHSGVDPLLRMLAQNHGEAFQGIQPSQFAAAAAAANAPGFIGTSPLAAMGGNPMMESMPSISPGEFYRPQTPQGPSPFGMPKNVAPIQNILGGYGGFRNGYGWG